MHSNQTQEIRKISDEATCLLSSTELDLQVARMAEVINHDLADADPVFRCVLLGGLIPYGKLIMHLNMPLLLDYVHVSRYQGNTVGSDQLKWLAKPVNNLKDRTVVIVDDILDEGLTMAAIKKYCQEQGAAKVLSAVLLDKKVKRAPGGLQTADYVAAEVEDKFVFGYGLDYKEYLRNMPGIYTLPNQ